MASRSLGTLTLDLVAKIGGFTGPLDQAARKTKKSTDSISQDLKSIGKAGGLLVGGAAAGLAVMVKQSINLQDEISKASQKVGVAVEDLSAYRYSADLAGVSFEALTGSLGKFNKNIDAVFSTGVGGAADALADLDISVKDTNGQLKSTTELFSEVADKFAVIEDGAVKTALAMDLFGKTGGDLIPLLNAGSKGLRENAEEAKRLGQIFKTETAKAAEELNDNLTRLQASISGMGNAIANDAIDELNELSKTLADPEFQEGIAAIGKGLIYIGRGAAEATGALGNFIKNGAEELAAQINGISNQDIPRLTKRLKELNAQLDPKSFSDYMSNSEVSDIFSSEETLQAQRDVIQKNIEAWENAAIEVKRAEIKARNSIVDDGYEFNSTDAEKQANRKSSEADILAKRQAREAAQEAANAQLAQQKELQQAYESTLSSLQKQIDLQNINSNAASVAYEIEAGGLKGIDELRSQKLIGLAREADLLERNLELQSSQREADLSSMGDAGRLQSVQLEYDLKNKIVKVNDTLTEQDKQRLVDNKKLQERNDLVAQMEEFLKQQRRSIDLYGVASEAAKLEYDIRNDILKVYGGIESAQAQEAIANRTRLDAQEKLQSITQITVDGVERIDEAFANAFLNIDKGFVGLRDGIVDGFKRTLAEIAQQAYIKPITIRLQQQLMGSATGAVGGAAGQGGGAGAGSTAGAGAMAGLGPYAIAGLAVVAAVGIWNKKQDAKFEKMRAEYRQATQSTGTLLGQANKKSESISGSIEELSKYAGDSLNVNYGMLSQLIAIREGITGVSAGFARQFGIKGPSDFSSIDTGTKTPGPGDSLKKVTTALFFDNLGGDILSGFANGITDEISKAVYREKKKITDTGIGIIGQSLADILSNGAIEAFAYADVKTTKKVIGITTSTKLKTKKQELDDVLLTQLGDVFSGAGDVLSQAAEVFGLDFENFIDKLLVPAQKLSLKGLEGDALTKEIEAFFSSTLDNWAGVLVDGSLVLEQYQKVGEGAFETVIRLASETAQFSDYAEKLVLNFKAVGFDAVNATQNLAELSNGFDSLNSSLANYAEKFFTDAEKFATLQTSLGEAFAKTGAALPKTRDEFRGIVEGLDLATTSGREQFATLIGLTDATDRYLTALERETNAKADARKEAEAALKAAANSAFDAFNRAIESDMDKVRDALSSSKQVADSLTSALRGMRLESAQSDLINRRQAQARLITANAISKAGGPLPGASEVDEILAALTQPSQELFATFEDYARDFYKTQQNIKELSDAAGGRVSIDERNLAALEESLEFYQKQIDTLNGIDSSVLLVRDSVNQLTSALIKAGITPLKAPPIPVLSSDYEKQQAQLYSSASSNTPAGSSAAEVVAKVNADLVSSLRFIGEQLHADNLNLNKITAKSLKILEIWDADGLPLERA